MHTKEMGRGSSILRIAATGGAPSVGAALKQLAIVGRKNGDEFGTGQFDQKKRLIYN